MKAVNEPGRGLSPDTKSTSTLTLGFLSPQNPEKQISAYNVVFLLQQPEQTKIVSEVGPKSLHL